MTTTARAYTVTPSATGVAGWDVDVEIDIAGRTIEGEVTLVADHDGTPAAWGQPDHWISGGMLATLRTLAADAFRAACRAIEAAACEAIEDSDIEPAAAE